MTILINERNHINWERKYIMKYIDTKAAAEKWNVSQQKVQQWCRNGLIIEAKRADGSSRWLIPEDAKKPDVGLRDASNLTSPANLRQQINNELNEELPKIRAKINSLYRACNKNNREIMQPEIDHLIAHEKWIKSMLGKC